MTAFTDATPRMGTLARKKVPGAEPAPAPKPPAPAAPKSTVSTLAPWCPKCDTRMTARPERDGWMCKWCDVPPRPAVHSYPTGHSVSNPAAAEPAERAPMQINVGAEGGEQKFKTLDPPQQQETASDRPPNKGGRPQHPMCCDMRTVRAGVGVCKCLNCGREFSTRPKAYASTGTAAPPAKPTERLSKAIAQSKPKAEVSALPETDKAPPPGLNGDHPTRQEERSRIPPSRPANNSRGGLVWKRVKDAPLPACKPSNQPKRNELIEEILGLGDPPDHVQVEGLDDRARRRLAQTLRRRSGAGEFSSYMTADGSAAVFHRAVKGEASR